MPDLNEQKNCAKHQLGSGMCGCGGGHCGVDRFRATGSVIPAPHGSAAQAVGYITTEDYEQYGDGRVNARMMWLYKEPRPDRMALFKAAPPVADAEGVTEDCLPTDPVKLLEFFAVRFEYAGVADGVARSYAKSIRAALSRLNGEKKYAPADPAGTAAALLRDGPAIRRPDPHFRPSTRQAQSPQENAQGLPEEEPQMKTHFSFDHEGTAVRNPTVSACGLTAVSPEQYGFRKTLTLGGSAWHRELSHDVDIYLHRNHSHDLGPYGTEFTMSVYDEAGHRTEHTLKVGILPSDRPAPVCLGFKDWEGDGTWTAYVNLGDDFVLGLEINAVKGGGWLTVNLAEYAQNRASTSMPLSDKRMQEILSQHAEVGDA